ncbi:hypothetical protein VSDG_05125 [Cytospora chrysosperma]|uniref:AB hydrolase-1 domain-containing protein n=1 Tax=Cytospora chrysosperma TaxID=252740 RepID=A0A423VXW1_CYTCH|nr:hypothetical protein VSDG_05125 [Valsa sordida]
MLNPNLPALVFIRICVFFLTYLPIIVLFLPRPFWVILPIEALYYFFVLRPFQRRLSHVARHPPPEPDRAAIFQRCLDNVPDPERYLSLWAMGADINDIKRDNVRDFLLWAFFDRQETSPEIEDELETFVAKTEAQLGRPLAPGRGSARHIRLTFDQVPHRYRSFVWYLTVGLVDSATHTLMLWNGFQFWPCSLRTNLLDVFPARPLASLGRMLRQSPSDELSYWYRGPQRADPSSPTTLPVVFLHGIGIGLYPYVPFLSSLPSTSAVLAVEILPISMRLTKTNILARPDFIRHLKKILQHHGIDDFVLIGHSYGTVLATHVLHDPDLGARAKGVLLVDPVTLLLHLPDVAYNFTRREPRTANEWQLWYLASMDPGIALVLGRHFFWRENIIWKEELVAGGRKAAVCLAGRDLIVDTRAVARYLTEGADGSGEVLEAASKGSVKTRSGVELLWFHMDHAQVFDNRQDYALLQEVVGRFVSQSS